MKYIAWWKNYYILIIIINKCNYFMDTGIFITLLLPSFYINKIVVNIKKNNLYKIEILIL